MYKKRTSYNVHISKSTILDLCSLILIWDNFNGRTWFFRHLFEFIKNYDLTYIESTRNCKRCIIIPFSRYDIALSICFRRTEILSSCENLI